MAALPRERSRSTPQLIGFVEGQPPTTVPIAAIVTAYERPEMTVRTVRRLQDCRPAPAEILVHVDGYRAALAQQLGEMFPDVTVLSSTERIGPGGGRNRLLQEAKQELVASFDDDSYPADLDFFQRAVNAATSNPDAAVLTATLLDGSGETEAAAPRAERVATFAGGACVYRRSVFLET